jgi:predicted phosphatase
MDKTVADLNIEHYRRLLVVETDPVKRQMIERLLAEEETKLALALAKKDETQNKT